MCEIVSNSLIESNCEITNLEKRTVVLVFTRYYLPGHKAGGPLRSISNMVEKLGDEIDFRIITSDRDSKDRKPYDNVTLDAWNHVGKAQVYYISSSVFSILRLLKLISETKYDVLYLNSFFDFVYTQVPLWARLLRLISIGPTIIAPRGELSPAALGIKRWKKRLYRRISNVIGLYGNLIWHASSEYEAENIRNEMANNVTKIKIAINVASNSPESLVYDERKATLAKIDDVLRIVFLARIAPMKNLDFALNVLAKVEIPIKFDIYGPIEDVFYWEKCKALIDNLPSNVSVDYKGAIDHSLVGSVLASHDLFFLPTQGENYGHVIMESLSAGTPVLIADTTPWRNLESAGVGWELPLSNQDQFVEKIHYAAKVSNEGYVQWRINVHRYALARAADPVAIAMNRRLFIDPMEN